MSTSRSLLPYEMPWPARRADRKDVAALQASIRGPRQIGLGLMIVFLGGFFLWGLTVPIAGGAVAPGVISPDGNRRTVQHLEGGIIAQLLVRDGDRVSSGQTLVVLEGLQARTVFNALHHQHLTLLATEARLQAEQEGLAELQLPAVLQSAIENPDLARIVTAQQLIFETRRAAHEARTLVLRQRIEQSEEQIRAIEAQVLSAEEQLQLIAEELGGKQQLLRSGLVPRPEVLRLQRVQSEITGKRGEYLSTIARTRQIIGENQMQILTLQAERQDKISEQIDGVRVSIAGLVERLQASRDILNRTVVSAPISGTVVSLRFKTVEGVIRPGEAILDIVPDEEKLLIDARVSPIDIDVVHGGLPAQVRLTAYSSRGLPRIAGVVRTVSADRLVDAATNQPYYLARVEVSRAELDRLGNGVELVPGMPAEVLIVRRERTMAQYLIDPLREAFRRSFREV